MTKMNVLTPREAARYLKLTPATITRMCREGKMEGAFKVGRVWRIPLDSPTLHIQLYKRHARGRV
jgi:excisionase family DNA binding protein